MVEQLTPAAAPRNGRGQPGINLGNLMPERSAQDVLSGLVRVRLGGAEYALGVLSIAANRRWKAGLEGHLHRLLGALESAGDDMGGILAAFATATDQLLDVLYAYDAAHDELGSPTRAGVLPERALLEERATDSEVLMATLGVWSAANPFAGVALSAMRAAADAEALTPSSQPTNSSRPSTAGRRRTSRRS